MVVFAIAFIVFAPGRRHLQLHESPERGDSVDFAPVHLPLHKLIVGWVALLLLLLLLMMMILLLLLAAIVMTTILLIVPISPSAAAAVPAPAVVLVTSSSAAFGPSSAAIAVVASPRRSSPAVFAVQVRRAAATLVTVGARAASGRFLPSELVAILGGHRALQPLFIQ